MDITKIEDCLSVASGVVTDVTNILTRREESLRKNNSPVSTELTDDIEWLYSVRDKLGKMKENEKKAREKEACHD